MTDQTDSRPPLPPRPLCVVRVNGVRCQNLRKYPNRDESAYCITHDDPDNPETQAHMAGWRNPPVTDQTAYPPMCPTCQREATGDQSAAIIRDAVEDLATFRSSLVATLRQHEGHKLTIRNGQMHCLYDGSTLMSVTTFD